MFITYGNAMMHPYQPKIDRDPKYRQSARIQNSTKGYRNRRTVNYFYRLTCYAILHGVKKYLAILERWRHEVSSSVVLNSHP